MHELSPGMDGFRMGRFGSLVEPLRVRKEARVVQTDVREANAETLLVAIGNRQDVKAFNELFRLFSGRAYAMGMKYLRNEQAARDLVQEAMLMIWQKAPLYDLDKGSAQTWIFTLVRNRCFDLLRKRKRQLDTLSADDIWPLGADNEEAEDLDDQRDAEIGTSQISKYYQELPYPQRQVIEEVFFNDLTHQEAAEKLSIPLGTLKSRLRLGLGRLRELAGISQ